MYTTDHRIPTSRPEWENKFSLLEKIEDGTSQANSIFIDKRILVPNRSSGLITDEILSLRDDINDIWKPIVCKLNTKFFFNQIMYKWREDKI